jgi:SAM-dependent methyltransferase
MTEHREEVARGRIVALLGKETVVPLPDGIADLVLMINLHHELAEPHATYREAFRLLRTGGQVLVVDWAPGADGGGPPQEIRATVEQLAAALRRAGFGIVAAHPRLKRHSLVTGVRTEQTVGGAE